MRYQHRYGFGGEPVISRRWGVALAAMMIVRRFVLYIARRMEVTLER